MGARDYSAEEVTTFLTELALQRGNVEATLRQMRHRKEQGTLERVPCREKADKLKAEHQAEYSEICAQLAPKIRQTVAEESIALARRYAAGEEEALELLLSKLDEIPARDLPNTVRNLATSRAIAIDKYEKANEGIAAQNAPKQLSDALSVLQRKFPNLFLVVTDQETIDAEAVEVQEAQLAAPAQP